MGGGPAGTAASIAAGRAGAKVTLVERYNHLGGLSTGGLVIWIDRMTDWKGTQVIAGVAHEFMDRLPEKVLLGPTPSDWGSQDTATADYWAQRSAAYHGIVTWSSTKAPSKIELSSMTTQFPTTLLVSLECERTTVSEPILVVPSIVTPGYNTVS